MIGMVLAAGAGRRLRPYTDTLPKALVPVDGDVTILDIALRNLAAVELRDVVIVVGYAAEAVESRKAALEKAYGVDLTLVHNDKAEIWNNAYSFWLACDHMSDGVLMVNGDTVHPVSVEETLLAARGPEILLAIDAEKRLREEEMKVRVGEDRELVRITKLMEPETAFGEYIGATLLEGSVIPSLKDALQATFERDPNLYYEDGYQELVDRGGRVDIVTIPSGTRWVEVDDHRDLAIAREIACLY
ncbi:MAG: phosphocholine cytidylyltransferase family protein [Nocardioidaceae bacterium]